MATWLLVATTPPSTFWADLNRHLENPEFRRVYKATSLEIQAVDDYVNAADRMPSWRIRRRIRKDSKGQVPDWDLLVGN